MVITVWSWFWSCYTASADPYKDRCLHILTRSITLSVKRQHRYNMVGSEHHDTLFLGTMIHCSLGTRTQMNIQVPLCDATAFAYSLSTPSSIQSSPDCTIANMTGCCASPDCIEYLTRWECHVHSCHTVWGDNHKKSSPHTLTQTQTLWPKLHSVYQQHNAFLLDIFHGQLCRSIVCGYRRPPTLEIRTCSSISLISTWGTKTMEKWFI